MYEPEKDGEHLISNYKYRYQNTNTDTALVLKQTYNKKIIPHFITLGVN